jgi:hypothetical protein
MCAASVPIVLLALVLFYSFIYPLHHDLAGSVLSGRLAAMLGDTYGNYSIYFPPAERVWFTVAARLSDLSGIRLDLAITIMNGGMVLIGSGLAYRVRQVTVGASPMFFVGSVSLLVALPILFKNIFGLREHLVILGLWPYFVLRMSEPIGRQAGLKLRACVGLWLGTTLLLKYLYSVIVLLVELADTALQRNARLLFRAENLIAGFLVSLYLASWLFDPAQRAAIGAMFSAIDANLADPKSSFLRILENCAYAVGFAALLRISRVPTRTTALCLAAVAGAIIVAWSQERWYTHHLFPIVMVYVGWWWAASAQLSKWGRIPIFSALAYSFLGQFLSTAQYAAQIVEVDKAISEQGISVAGKRVGVLAMHPSPYNQYLASHDAARWIGLMNNAYVAAEVQHYDTQENAGKKAPPVMLTDSGRRLLHDQMLRLWEDMPPDVLILDHSTSWPLRHLDVEWTRVFSRDPRFNAILQNYRPVLRHTGEQTRFTYYVRAN